MTISSPNVPHTADKTLEIHDVINLLYFTQQFRPFFIVLVSFSPSQRIIPRQVGIRIGVDSRTILKIERSQEIRSDVVL